MIDDTTRAVLARLHRGGAWGYWWTLPARASTWWPTEQPAPLPSGAVDIYFGIHPCREIPTNTKSGKNADPSAVRSRIESIAAINCLFGEFDLKDFDNDRKAVRAHITGLETPPHVLVSSGGGYHTYWLFDDPWLLVTDEDRSAAMEAQANWVAQIGSDPAAKDLARVLRVPGTRNYKYQPAPLVQLKRVQL